jgi:UDP-3-O-[3-hydroxymyristoyl] glucosamine N-acyltransferase
VKATRSIPVKGRRGSGRPVPGGSFTLADLAGAVGGRVCGEGSLTLSGIEGLERAGPGDLSWVADRRRAREAGKSRAGALLVASEEDSAGKPAVVVDSPALALIVWMDLYLPAPGPKPGVSKRAHIHSAARLGRGVSVAAGATVEAGAVVGARTVLCAGSFVGRDAVLGEDCYLHPNAAVLERCSIGARCVLQAGAVVGSDGFGYVWDGSRHRKIPQKGTVRIGDDVEIGANSAIDRATLGETLIGRGTKIDNLVQVGHNVVVGEDSLLCGQAGIAGSARLGRRVTLAGQVGVGDHIAIGDGTTATGQAGVTGNLPAGGVFSGMPAAPHREFLRRAALVARLPELARRLEQVERNLAGNSKRKREGEKSWKSESPKS